MEISKTEIGNALTSADENHILATANDIYDETQKAYQSDINTELKEGKQDKHRFILDVANYSFEDLLEACKKNYDIIAMVEGVHVQINTYYIEENSTAIHLGGRVSSLEETHTMMTDVNVYTMEFFATQDEISYNLRNILLKGGGKGTQFLADDGQYKSLPEFEDISNLQASIDELQQTQDDLNVEIQNKQDKLVSGTNIKTINGTSLLGEGDVSISGGSGGGDFDSSGTYPNLTAGKATKLATARTISLSGATVGSATFDGSKDVNININSIPQGYIQWAGKNSYGALSPLEATAPLFSTNRFALINPECVTIEYSQDGGNTWIKHPNDASPSVKTYLFTPEVSTVNLALGNKALNQETTPLDMLRVTVNGVAMTRYFSINTFLVYMSNINDSSVRCSFSRTTWGGDTINSKDYQVTGWPAWNTINLATPIAFGKSNSAYVTKEITFTFKLIGNVVRPPMVCNIACIANTLYNAETTYPKTGHLYKIDYLKNATFPANVTATKHITEGGTNQQVVLGNGSLKSLDELSPITDADAEILLDNHIHNINVNTNSNDVNISVIESSKNGNTWETEDNDIQIPLATATSAGVMSLEDKIKLDDLTNDGYVYPTNYLANWNGNSTIEVDDGLQIELDNITSYNSNTEGLIFTVNIQTPSQHDGEDYIYLSLYDNDETELAYMEHLITDDDCYNGSLQLELKCPLAAITSGYIDLYNNTNEPINIANPILKRYEVKNVRDISDKLLEKIGDINTILESIINS